MDTVLNKIEDKIRGMFLGIAIGDSLGMPVETFKAADIATKYGRITTYHAPKDHKWFKGEKAGLVTDDTQLTLAVARALITSPALDIMPHVEEHVAAYKKTTNGWGRSTRESIRNLANGSSWETSASGPGTGNGIAMKVAPMGALVAYQLRLSEDTRLDYASAFWSLLTKITCISHKNRNALCGAYAHVTAIWLCLESIVDDKWNKEEFTSLFKRAVCKACEIAATTTVYPLLPESPDNIADRFNNLSGDKTQEQIIEECGGGTPYCFDSQPFTYNFFLRDPLSIESLFDVISAGGDTDSNGSMVGAMLGAMHGTKIFPQELIDGFDAEARLEVEEVAAAFTKTYFG